MRRLWTRALLLGAVGLAAGSSAGCAEERAPIMRVQPLALAKSFFVGENLASTEDDPEFYFQTTLVDVGYGAMQDGLFTSTYAQQMSRIKWHITEDLLIARITYERIEDSDGKGAGPTSNDGIVAAAYRIESQFDIRRDYNPTTGEESNILVENTIDRPWNQREYFRVNWGENLATDAYDFDTLSLLGVYGGIEYEPLAYDVTDPPVDGKPAHPDAPHFDPDMGYFDVTNKAFAKPGLIDLSSFGWGIDTFPACYLDPDIGGGTAPVGSCNPVELTLRQSFRRVGEPVLQTVTDEETGETKEKLVFVSTDFEPKHWDGLRFQAYGPFYEDRHGYARDYGIVDKKWYRLIDRYNIWKRSHYYKDPVAMTGEIKCYVPPSECAGQGCVGTPYGADPNRDEDFNGTADECQSAGVGSQCDTFNQKCTLPYQQREEKPVLWYYTQGSDLDYFEGTEWATHEWDVAMRSAVLTAKYAECVRAGGADCGKYPMLRSQQDSNWDAIQLAREVDDCRHQVKDANGKVVHDGTKCESVADKVGTARGYEPEVIAIAKLPEMIILCHSPVEANDPELCAPPDRRLPENITAAQCAEAQKAGDIETINVCSGALSARIGDLRYNQVNVIKTPQSPAPWGIYTDAEDPITGEKISSGINVWSFQNDLFSQSIVDQARYIKGELKTEEITDGKYIYDWAAAAEAAGSRGSLGQMSKSGLNDRIAAISGKEIEPVGEGIQPAQINNMPELRAQMKAKLQEFKGIRAEVSAPSNNAPVYAARLRALGNEPDIEAQLMTIPVQQYAGIDGLPQTKELWNMASPLRGGNRTIQRQFARFKQNALGKRGACILNLDDVMSPAPLAIADLADVLQEKFGTFNPQDSKDAQQERAEKMRKYIAQRAHYAVIIHEMGHSIALRHNFVSSSDAFNYRSQYWQLRTKNGTVSEACADLSPDGENCVGPRYFDPITENEKKNLIWMFMQSSTMDYAGEITQDFLGLGAYDFAAARMFYGDAVAVFADPSFNVLTARGRGVIEKVDTFGGLLGWDPQIGTATGKDTDPIHYSQLQKEYNLIQNCVDVDPAGFKPASWDEKKHGVFHPVLDGLIVSVDGKYSRCKQQPVDFVQWNSQRKPAMGASSEAGLFYRGGPSVDLNNRTRVPYGFATDSWADLGNSAVYRHDNGADIYELFDFFITQQEAGHIFDNYRRGRQSFSVRNAANRTLGRFNEKMRDSAKGIGLLVNIYKDFGIEIGVNQKDIVDFALKDFFPANALASGIAFDHFARMMARPEIGDHLRVNTADPVYRPRDLFYSVASTTKPAVIIPNGATGFYGNISSGGALLENTLSDNNGEYDRDFTMNAGSYYGKMYVPMLLTESEDNFISDSVTDFYDSRYRSISIADVFSEGYRRWLANNLTGDDEIKGVRIPGKPGGAPDVTPELIPTGPIGTTSWWPIAGPEVCFPNVNSTVCSQYGAINSDPFKPGTVANTAIIDPLVGWEQQKFMIAWTYVYLPENQKRYWLDRLELKELGIYADPNWTTRMELHIPDGSTYVARRFGTEVIFGKTVQKGIAARVLQYANELMSRAYQGKWVGQVDENGNQMGGEFDKWFIADIDPNDGLPIVVFDKEAIPLNSNGGGLPNGKPGCSSTAGDNLDCICEGNVACLTLEKYKTVPWFLARMSNHIEASAKGLYDP